MQPSMFRTALVLALMSVIVPFSIDMYLPAMPDMGVELNASVGQVQLTLTMFFLAFGASQLFYGPLSDAVGRKLPIYIGVSIFALASIACAVAPTIEWLMAARFVQGLGGAAVMVVPRAIVRDQYTGPDATRLMAMMMLVTSVSPMLAPLAGSFLLIFGTWRLIFWVLVVASVISLILTYFGLPETLAAKDRVPVNLRALTRGAKVLLRDPVFMGLTIVGGFGMASFFVFIASASFVYAEQFGLSPTGFSLAFAVNAIGFFSSSQFAGYLGGRFGMVPVMRWAVMGFAAAAVLNVVLYLAGIVSLPLIIALLFLGNAGLGLVIPTSMVTALDEHGDIAGLASSLGGTMQMVAGGLMISLTAPFFDNTALPMLVAIAVCAVGSLVVALLTLPRIAASSAAPAAH